MSNTVLASPSANDAFFSFRYLILIKLVNLIENISNLLLPNLQVQLSLRQDHLEQSWRVRAFFFRVSYLCSVKNELCYCNNVCWLFALGACSRGIRAEVSEREAERGEIREAQAAVSLLGWASGEFTKSLERKTAITYFAFLTVLILMHKIHRVRVAKRRSQQCQ